MAQAIRFQILSNTGSGGDAGFQGFGQEFLAQPIQALRNQIELLGHKGLYAAKMFTDLRQEGTQKVRLYTDQRINACGLDGSPGNKAQPCGNTGAGMFQIDRMIGHQIIIHNTV